MSGSYQTFPYSTAPTTGASRQVQARVLKAEFGDGYSQRVGDGINTIRYVYAVSWENISRTDANLIDTFFRARGGHQSFYWTAPGEASPRLWVCETWQRTHSTATLDSISATFTEVFDL